MNTKSAFVAIVGRPNVGKSSLLNSLLGEKVAIVTNKPQTTRTRITGVLTKDTTQYVFIDTPGLHKAKTKLSNSMVSTVMNSVFDVDIVLLMIDVNSKINEAESDLIESIKKTKAKAILLINKIDLATKKEKIMDKINEFNALYKFDVIIPISVLLNDGVNTVLKEIDKYAVDSVHFFPDDTLTDQPERVIAGELIREKLLNNLSQEIPHGVAVVVNTMKERDKKEMLDIDVTIFCERQSHKGIVIGKNGASLKRIATQSRYELEAFFEIPVNLKCFVKVKENWRNREGLIRDFGLS